MGTLGYVLPETLPSPALDLSDRYVNFVGCAGNFVG